MNWAYSRQVDDAVSLVEAIVDEARKKNVGFMAGSIAYSAFVSLLPLLLLLLLVVSAFGGQLLASYLVGITGTYLSPTGQGFLTDAVTRAAGRTGLSILGVVVLVWGMLRVFRGLDTAFSVLYGTQGDNDLFNQVRDGLIVLIAMGIAISAMVVAGVAFAVLPHVPFAGAVTPVLLIIGLTITFIPIYYVFPDTDVSVREAFPGAVVAAVGWAGLEVVFGLYVSYTATDELYGAIGGIILLITWLYFGALMLLVGAVTNIVLAGRDRSAPS